MVRTSVCKQKIQTSLQSYKNTKTKITTSKNPSHERDYEFKFYKWPGVEWKKKIYNYKWITQWTKTRMHGPRILKWVELREDIGGSCTLRSMIQVLYITNIYLFIFCNWHGPKLRWPRNADALCDALFRSPALHASRLRRFLWQPSFREVKL